MFICVFIYVILSHSDQTTAIDTIYLPFLPSLFLSSLSTPPQPLPRNPRIDAIEAHRHFVADAQLLAKSRSGKDLSAAKLTCSLPRQIDCCWSCWLFLCWFLVCCFSWFFYCNACWFCFYFVFVILVLARSGIHFSAFATSCNLLFK